MSQPAPQPSPLATPLAWDLVAPGYTDLSTPHFEKYAADALKLAGLRAGESVVDVAAGPGSLSLQAARLGAKVEALDFSNEMLDRHEQRRAAANLSNVNAQQGDGQKLPYGSGQFDAAFSMFGLIFFPNRAAGFRELHRVLKPNGRAVVSSWQPMGHVPVIAAVFEALQAELPHLPFGDGKGPLSERADFGLEMSAAGFDVELHAVTHAVEAPSVTAFFADLRRNMAPLVLLAHKMGPQAFEPVAQGILKRLVEKFGSGPVSVPMPAWLGLGRAQ